MFKNKTAFTLVELIIAVAIMGIVSAITTVSLSGISSRGVEVQGRKIVSDLSLTREMAASLHIDHCIRFSANAYDVYENACGGAVDFIRQERMSASITSPAVPFDVMFYRVNNSPLRRGGTAFSSVSTSNELLMTLYLQGRTQNVRLFEATGYARLE